MDCEKCNSLGMLFSDQNDEFPGNPTRSPEGGLDNASQQSAAERYSASRSHRFSRALLNAER